MFEQGQREDGHRDPRPREVAEQRQQSGEHARADQPRRLFFRTPAEPAGQHEAQAETVPIGVGVDELRYAERRRGQAATSRDGETTFLEQGKHHARLDQPDENQRILQTDEVGAENTERQGSDEVDVSGVEPTAHALIALKKAAGHVSDARLSERIRSGEALLLDVRHLPGAPVLPAPQVGDHRPDGLAWRAGMSRRLD